jgi:hypothetical protein
MGYPTGPWARVLWFNVGAKTWTNDTWFTIASPPSGFDISAEATGLLTNIQPAWTACMNQEYGSLGLKLYVHNGTYTSSFEKYSPADGTLTNVALPEEVAVIGALSADVATRAGQGRIFVAGLDSSMVDGNRPSTAGNTAVTNLLTQLNTQANWPTLNGLLSVWSRKENLVLSPVYPSVQSVLAALRPRRPRF